MPYKDPDAARAYYAAWAKRNRERLAAYKRDWLLRNPQAATDSDRARHANQKAKQFGAPGRITVEDVRAVRGDAACIFCGSRADVGIDHRVPLSRGGGNTRANLQPCCLPCNKRKGTGEHAPERWARVADSCIACGSSERAHKSHGLCNRCYQRPANRRYRGRPRAGEHRLTGQRMSVHNPGFAPPETHA